MTHQIPPDAFKSMKQLFDRQVNKMPKDKECRKIAIKDLFIALLDGYQTEFAAHIFMSARLNVDKNSIIRI